ncbi:MAG: single-stranded-DNA-specific exonuclease RecJ [Opitutales bacterium]|nr:single-stranded-DNA-specific exonuclease RecJ [Opitutales bacterium]
MKWIHTESDVRLTHELQDALALLPPIASVLVKMGYTGVECAEKFLSPKLAHVTDPFLIPNLEPAAERIMRAIDAQETVSIVGDYDVDGVTAVTLLVSFLRRFGLRPHYFVPRRKDEGYGLSTAIVDRVLTRERPTLFFALDCGTNANEQVERLRSRGIDVVIVDHHRSKTAEAPDAIMVNPNSAFSAAPDFSPMCTAGLMFKVLHGVLKIMRSRRDPRSFDIILREYLDLVALGTITDISPLVGENRTMVWFGLRQMKNTKRKGLRALISASNIADTADILPVDISHRIGPRINASGRLADAALPVEMFLCENEKRCAELARELSDMNRDRQEIERGIYDEAMAQIEADVPRRNALLACGEWHPGVVGIVAGKLSRHFNRPCVVLGIEGNLAKGSGRGVPGLNLIDVLRPYGDELDSWGGHPMAVGISVDVSKVAEFREYLDRAVGEALAKAGADSANERTLDIAAWLSPADITAELFDQIEQLSPFGEGNPEPVFGIRNIVMPSGAIVFGGDNFRFQILLPNFSRLGVVAWHKAEGVPAAGTRVDLAVRLSWNNYNGRKYQQAELVAWRPAAPEADAFAGTGS